MTVFIKCFEKNSKKLNETERGCAKLTQPLVIFYLIFYINFNSF